MKKRRQDDLGSTWWRCFEMDTKKVTKETPVLVAWFRDGHKEGQDRMTKETPVLVAWFCENISSGGVVLRKYQFWWRGFELDTKKDNTG